MILGAIGFSPIGPVAGSIAAGWQASIGSVAAGSFFAFLQSAAMGGAAVTALTGVGVLGCVVALGAGLPSIGRVLKDLIADAKGPVESLVEGMGALANNFTKAVGGLAANFMGLLNDS